MMEYSGLVLKTLGCTMKELVFVNFIRIMFIIALNNL